MWEWVALVVVAVLLFAFTNLRTVRVLPAMLKIRRAANANLTSVKMRYFPHLRRRHHQAIAVVDAALFVLLAFVLSPRLDAPYNLLVGLFLLVYGMLGAGVTRAFGDWYDDLHWKTRTLKPDIMEPIPWDGNHLVYTRTVGLEAAKEQEEDADMGMTATQDRAPAVTAEYWIARESAPDKWWGNPPSSGYFVVWRKAKDAQLSISQKGYQFGVGGHVDGYMLGGGDAEAFAEGLPPRYRHIVDGIDPHLRAFIYANYKEPKPDWASGVLVIEEPDDVKAQADKAQTVSMLDLMDLRAKLANYRRSEDKIAEDKQRMTDRLTRSKG